MTGFEGVPVIVDNNLPYFQWEQVKFPRSKKVRIRKKWRKQTRNFSAVPLENPVWMINGTAHMHSVIWDQLRQQLKSGSVIIGRES